MNSQHFLRPISNDQLGLLIHAYLDDCELGDLSPRTLANYRGTLEKFHWWILETGRPLDPEAIRPPDIREYLRYVQSTPGRWGSDDPKTQRAPKPSTIDTYYRQLRGFFAWLVEQEYIDRSPMDKRLRRPKMVQQEINPFTNIELKRIANALRKLPEGEYAARDRAIIAVLLDVGLRASELVSLTVSDVDVMTGTILVRKGKGNKTRTVHLGSSARRAVRRYWIRYRGDDAENDDAPFFPSARHKHMTRSGLRQLTERIGNLAGVHPSHPHRYRHAAALNALRAGMDVFHVQNLLGHSDLSMTQRYVKLAETDIARAAKEHSALDSMKLGL